MSVFIGSEQVCIGRCLTDQVLESLFCWDGRSILVLHTFGRWNRCFTQVVVCFVKKVSKVLKTDR